MITDDKNLKIGYSGILRFEECYEYNENSSYLA